MESRPPKTSHRLTSSDAEHAHEELWYARATRDGFFEREGMRRLTEANVANLQEIAPLDTSARVLSIGCGLGTVELAIAQHVGSIVGIDISSVAIAEAGRRARILAVRNVEFRCGSVRDMKFTPAAFDGVLILGVLHHLSRSERRDLLQQAAACLGPKGWICTWDPNARGVLRRLFEGALRKRSNILASHERSLDPREISGELHEAGCASVTVGYRYVFSGSLPWVLSWRSRTFWKAAFGLDRLLLKVPIAKPIIASEFSALARLTGGEAG